MSFIFSHAASFVALFVAPPLQGGILMLKGKGKKRTLSEQAGAARHLQRYSQLD
jgi:hypothetical protein